MVTKLKIRELNVEEKIIELLLEDREDLYYLALILDKGDIVYSWTWRQIKVDKGTGKAERGERIKVYMGIQVEKVEFQKFTDRLRILGKVVEAPEYLHIKGRYHTISLYPITEVKIIKKELRQLYLKLIDEAVKKTYKNLLICLGDQETAFGILSRGGVEIVLTLFSQIAKKADFKKRSYMDEYREYFTTIVNEIWKFLNRERYDRVILAAPRFLQELFQNFLSEKHRKLLNLMIFLNVEEGGIAGIYELVRREELARLAKELRLDYEKKLVETIFTLLERGNKRLAIGLKEVAQAAKLGAIQKLLITDTKFIELKEKEKLSEILENIEKSRGEIVIISSEYEHGMKLKSLGGIAAFLYFPVS
ncbi:MAG: mRNA surveillance protein pelota [Thermoprotei archaeon]|nr:MAG: mRNA surveillance protein pelota [Thermoprotei archaeon]